MALVKIIVTLKEGILDPQGQTSLRALRSMGYHEVEDLRIGKYMEMKVVDDEDGERLPRIEEMCERLLANPIIEDYRIEIEETP